MTSEYASETKQVGFYQAATRGKTTLTRVLPGFCKIECGVGNGGTLVMWLPLHSGGLACPTSTKAAMVVHAFQVSLGDGATIMIHTVCPTDIEPTSGPNISN